MTNYQIIKGGGFALEKDFAQVVPYGHGCASWPCWEMSVGDLWIVPNEPVFKNAQTAIHTHARNSLKGAMKFRTKTIDGKLHVWRVK